MFMCLNLPEDLGDGVKSFAKRAELSRAEEKYAPCVTYNFSASPGQHCEGIEFFGFR
jgi:hypothetical protein